MYNTLCNIEWKFGFKIKYSTIHIYLSYHLTCRSKFMHISFIFDKIKCNICYP